MSQLRKSSQSPDRLTTMDRGAGWTATWENTWRDFQYGLRSLAERKLHACRGDDAGSRRRPHHRRLQHRQHGAAAAPALSRLRSARTRRRARGSEDCGGCTAASHEHDLAGTNGVASEKHDVVRSRLHDQSAHHVDAGGRVGAIERRARLIEPVVDTGRTRAARAHARRLGRGRWLQHRRHQHRSLAAVLSGRPGHHRPNGRAQDPGTGIGIGLAGAIALTGYLEGMLYGVTPLDPLTYVAVVALFAAVTSIASYLPARRATKIDPMTALRYD
jgi:hypothetical protein